MILKKLIWNGQPYDYGWTLWTNTVGVGQIQQFFSLDEYNKCRTNYLGIEKEFKSLQEAKDFIQYQYDGVCLRTLWNIFQDIHREDLDKIYKETKEYRKKIEQT